MAKEKFEHSYPGKQPQAIYEATRKTLDEIATRHGLRHETDTVRFSGTIARMGANGRYQVNGEKLSLELEFGMLVPGPIRKRVADEINAKLDRLL